MSALLHDLIRWANSVVLHLEFEASAYPERRTAHLAEQGRELIERLRGDYGSSSAARADRSAP